MGGWIGCKTPWEAGGFGDYAATANRAASAKLRRTSMELQSNQRANVDVESGHDGQQVDTSGARVMEFLQKHTAFQLIPESNKVVVLDTKLPIRQAFHAFYEQGIYAAPLWDEDSQDFVGLLSAGDFIDIMSRLTAALADREELSDAELDQFTIQLIRDEYEKEGMRMRSLLYVKPEDSLYEVALKMTEAGVHNALLSHNSACPAGSAASASTPTSIPHFLHMTNLAEVLACLNRHFRGIPSALPLFSQPIERVAHRYLDGTFRRFPFETHTTAAPRRSRGVLGARTSPHTRGSSGRLRRTSLRRLHVYRRSPSPTSTRLDGPVRSRRRHPFGRQQRLCAGSIKDLSVAQALGATRPTALNEQNDLPHHSRPLSARKASLGHAAHRPRDALASAHLQTCRRSY